MTSEHGKAPIYKLNVDVLHEIFKTNTVTEFPSINHNVGWPKHEPEHLPLTITYRTSHVCKQWRDIILQSSTIWGRCIDFDVMKRWSRNLRQLVFERAKESLLSITAIRHSHTTDPFYLEILAHQWGRIQQLDIFLTVTDFENVSLMKLLCRPAPSLSFCRIASCEPTGIQHSANLLSNQAPSLVFLWCPTVFVPKTPRNTLRVPSSKLRYLHLDSVQMTARSLLETCLEMPLLEVFWLEITFDQDGTTKNKLPRPYLPRLTKLHVKASSFDVYSLFMDQIIPANGCSVRTRHMVQGVDQISNEELDNMQSTLLRYSQSFLNAHQECTNISLHVRGEYHIFACDDDHFAFAFTQAYVMNDPYYLPLELHFRLLDIIGSLKFPARTHAINSLNIIPGYQPSSRYNSIVDLPTLLPRVVQVLDSMEWVNHITLTDGRVLHRFTWIILGICLTRFPALTSLKLMCLSDCTWFCGEGVKSALVNKHKRAPLQLIALIFRGRYPHELDLRFMSNMPGLTVTWTIWGGDTVYHKCGVDDPEQLNSVSWVV